MMAALGWLLNLGFAGGEAVIVADGWLQGEVMLRPALAGLIEAQPALDGEVSSRPALKGRMLIDEPKI